MIVDTYIIVLAIAMGLACGWALITLLWGASRGFRKATRSLGCKLGYHAPSGRFEPAVGGRSVQRCLYCDCVVYEVKVTKNSLRRTK